ncbi:hypothetical protein CCAX7_18290 [Capsulimonas corticalis]|uniref:Uncharacterized protein n=1 Tax=Capsulimonas corticalis TaxID=2219043 RepID=A0A402D5E3_9BACT|nr:FIST N-terminal domain-containing protein [Capsulimonas corticalis]BDI29778.1 hypothetical protein CCAX7_18290 [Capsulimonas corticalis]
MRTRQHLWTEDEGWGEGAAGGLGDAAQLALVFGGMAAIEASGAFAWVRSAYPAAAIFGCTTSGEIHGCTVQDETVSVTAVHFEHTRLASFRASVSRPDLSFDAGQELARKIDTDELTHVFLLAEGLQVIGSDLLDGVNSILPDHVTVSGGFAGDGDRIVETYIWNDGEPHPCTVAAIAFYGERLQVSIAASGEWMGFGPERLVTKSKKNVVYELDGRSALALYKQYLGEDAAGLPSTGMMYPLGLRVPGTERRVLRSLLAVNEEDQSLTFGGNIPEQSLARLFNGNFEQMIEGADAAAQVIREAIPASGSQLAILVSCYGRRLILRQLIEEEVEAVAEVLGPETALTGFYSYGEAAPVTLGGKAQLHNQTVTITCFNEV